MVACLWSGRSVGGMLNLVNISMGIEHLPWWFEHNTTEHGHLWAKTGTLDFSSP